MTPISGFLCTFTTRLLASLTLDGTHLSMVLSFPQYSTRHTNRDHYYILLFKNYFNLFCVIKIPKLIFHCYDCSFFCIIGCINTLFTFVLFGGFQILIWYQTRPTSFCNMVFYVPVCHHPSSLSIIITNLTELVRTVELAHGLPSRTVTVAPLDRFQNDNQIVRLLLRFI